jgi:hypothetical protein
MNAAREARQHGRRGEALYQTKLHRVELWSLPAGPKFSAGRGDMFPDCIRARGEKLLPIRSRNPSVIYALLPGLRNSVTQGGYPQKLHSRVAA